MCCLCRWVPELKLLPTKYVHSPWDAPATVLQKSGVALGQTYPHRVTTRDMHDLRMNNLRALRAAREKRKQNVPEDVDRDGYDVIQVPEGAARGVYGGRVRVFTVPALRSADEQPGEFSSFGNKRSGQQNRSDGIGKKMGRGK